MIKKYIILLFSFLGAYSLYAQVDYQLDVLPIFEVKCASCHGINNGPFNSGLNITTEEAILSLANIVVPGDYESSYIYQRITGIGGYMPPSWAPNGNEILSSDEVNTVVAWINGLNDGCTDPLACNYDESATDDDDSCEYESCAGCIDDTACNYDIDATIDDNSCDYSCIGCTDPFACNYNLNSTIDCSQAGDLCCVYASGCDICSGDQDGNGFIVDGDADADGVCDNDEIEGCTDSESCTFDEDATDDDGSCEYLDTCGVCGGDDTLCIGCTDINACNYDINATVDDDSCEYESCTGCTDPFACDFLPTYTIPGPCDYSCLGCTDSSACNYNADATQEDGSCEFDSCVGCTDENACNYNADATEDDGSCEYQSCVGCLDENACNYDETAIIDCFPDNAIVIENFDGPYFFGQSAYYCSDYITSWTDASSVAQTFGMNLISIDSQDEQDVITNLLYSFPNINNIYWIGLSDFQTEGNWVWSSGETPTYFNWCSADGQQEPNGGVAENYVQMYGIFDSSGECIGSWNDWSNGNSHFIMELNLEQENCCIYTEDACETCENGQIIDNDSDNDGICDEDELLGCIDQFACNYNENATEDDESCIYVNSSNSCGYCSGETDGTGQVIVNDSDSDGLCDSCDDNISDCELDPCPDDFINDVNGNNIPDCQEVVGCTDSNACNFNSAANTDDGSCILPVDCETCSGETDGTGTVVDNDSDGDGICDDDEVLGCTNPSACNWNSDATDDDGSCDFDSCIGCTDPSACNFCEDCTISLSTSCNYDTCCDDISATNYDPNCTCPAIDVCFTIPNGCDFDCFPQNDGIFPIPVTSTYGAFEISCFGASDGVLAIDFNTMNLISDGVEPYTVQVYQQLDINNDGQITADEEILIGDITESNPSIENLIAADYVLLAYDANGCCGQGLISMNQPGENTLITSEYVPIACPGGVTDIDFTIEGSVGQFDVYIDNVLVSESVEGGTVTVSTDDLDGDGIPDDFVFLSTSTNTIVYGPNQNFWPDGIDFNGDGSIEDNLNDCEDSMTIFVNIEDDDDIDNGDLIGAFYTLGDGTLQSFTYNTYTSSTSGSSFFTLQICEGADNGFNNGEEIVFLVYDVSENIINEVEVEYEYNSGSSTYTDVFETNSSFDGILITSLSIVGESGDVPDFTITVGEGDYNIQVDRTTEIDSDGDGLIDDFITCTVIDTNIEVTDPNDMSVDVMTGGVVCSYLDDNGIVQTTPDGYIQLDNFTGGTPPYSYTWTNPNGQVIIENLNDGIESLEDFDGDDILDDLDFLGAGLYTLLVVDDNNCEFPLDILLEGSDLLLSDFIIDYNLIACSGGSTDLNISLQLDGDIIDTSDGLYTFNWYNNSTNSSIFDSEFDGNIIITNVEEGSYTATIIDETGCSYSQIIPISIDPAGQLAIFNPFIEVLCGSEDGFVSFSDCPTENGTCVANGTPPFSYSWNLVQDLDGDGVFEDYTSLGYPPDVSSATLDFGTYSFEVTDSNGCSGESIFTLSQPDPIIFESSFEPIICDGDLTTISLEIVQGNPGLYDFIFEGETTTITVGDASNLDFEWQPTDVNMTLLFNDISIFSPNDVIGVFYNGVNGITCGGSTTYDGTGIFNIAAWGSEASLDNGFQVGEDIFILLNSGGIVYELNVLDFDNAFDSPNFYIPQGLSAITSIELGDQFVQGPSFETESLSDGSYFIEVYDGNQCYWSELIDIEGVEDYYMLSTQNNPICDEEGGGEIIVDAFGGTASNDYLFIWTNTSEPTFIETNFGSSSTINDLNPGVYNLQIFDNNNCLLEETFNVEFDTPTPDILISNELCGNDGEITICVDWIGDLNFILESNSFSENINLSNLSGETTCYTFGELESSLYTLSANSINNSISDIDGCLYVENDIFIESEEPIAVEFFTDNPLCYNGTGSVFITTIEGGNPPYSIDWQGVNTDAVSVGSHQFVVTDANNCEFVQNYSIQNGSPINMNTSSTNNVCFGENNGSISFNLSGGASNQYTYSLLNNTGGVIASGSGLSNTFSLLSSGLYFLEVENGIGCLQSEPVQIFDVVSEIVFDEIEVTNSECYEENGFVELNVFNQNNNNFIYNWFELIGPEWDIDNDGVPNDIDLSIDGGVLISSEVGLSSLSLSASEYYVFVESVQNSCLSENIQFTIEGPEPFQIIIEDINLSCYGQTTSVIPFLSGGSDGDIDNDGLANNNDPDIDGDGVYIGTDCVANCNDDDDDIDNDSILNDDDDYIGGTNFNGISTNSHPSFTNGVVIEDQFGNIVDSDNLTSGAYIAYAIDSEGCSSNIEEFNIVSPDDLSVELSYQINNNSVLDLTSDIELFCYEDAVSILVNVSGGTIDINQPEGYIFDCTDQYGNAYDISNTFSSGNYTLVVTDNQGCQSTQEFSILTAPDELLINYDISLYNNYNISCNGEGDGYIDISPYGGVGVYTYEWSNGAVTQDIDNLSAGTYTVTITDENGCILIESIDLVEPDPLSIEVEYIIDASCDEEDDGGVLIRTFGGNPPFNYVVNGSTEILTTYEELVIIEEGEYSEEVLVTESDIYITGLNGNTWNTVSILNDSYQCMDSPYGTQVYIGSLDDNCLFIPSVFTPNGDGINDTWQIDGINLYSNPTIRVFNRWGQKVFESLSQLYVPWDGIGVNNEEQEIATYYYVIDLNLDNKNYNGSVTIKR